MGSHTDDGWIPAPTLPSVGNSAGPFTAAVAVSVIRTAPHLTSIATTSAKLSVKFGVAEEEPDGPRAGLPR